MTRKEEIARAAKDHHIKQFPNFTFGEYVAFINGAKWADRHPHWISVKDELPPKKSEYDGLSNNVLATDGKEIYESVYNHDFEEWFTHDFWAINNITHWMPMPQPPVLSNSENTGKDMKGGEQ